MPASAGSAISAPCIRISPEGKLERYYVGYKDRFKKEWNMLPHKNALEMRGKAVGAVQSDEAVAVAKALEMRHDASLFCFLCDLCVLRALALGIAGNPA